MIGKTPSQTAIHDHVHRIFPNDLNAQGTVFGGLIMSIVDRLAHLVAERHSGRICVTASVDQLIFLASTGYGDNLIFKVSMNRSWNSSMEVGVKVFSERRFTLEKKHIVSAYLTFVALDDQKKPVKVPPVIPETPIEKQRFEEAQIRREHRMIHKKAIAISRKKSS